MRRFMGVMPSDEIEKRATFKDKNGLEIRIDAGPHGWTVHWADSSNNFRDVDATTESNFKEALDYAVSKVGKLTEEPDWTTSFFNWLPRIV